MRAMATIRLPAGVPPLLWRTAAGLAIAVPLLAAVLLRTDLSETAEAMRRVDYAWIPGAIALFSAAVWFQAMRWHYLLRPLAGVSPGRLYPVVFTGHLGNALVPLRGGEILRALILGRREGVSRMAVLGTLAVERALDGLVLAAMLLLSLAFVGESGSLWGLFIAGTVLFGLATAALAALAVWQERAVALADPLIGRLPGGWQVRLRTWLTSFVTGTTALRSPTGMLAVLLTTAAFWSIIIFVYLIVGEAFDLGKPFGTYLLVTAAGNLSVAVPSSQGGLGPFEFFVRETLVFSDVTASAATAYALVLHAILLAPMIGLGLISLWVVGLPFGAVIRSAEPGPVLDEEELTGVPGGEQEHLAAEEPVQRPNPQVDP